MCVSRVSVWVRARARGGGGGVGWVGGGGGGRKRRGLSRAVRSRENENGRDTGRRGGALSRWSVLWPSAPWLRPRSATDAPRCHDSNFQPGGVVTFCPHPPRVPSRTRLNQIKSAATLCRPGEVRVARKNKRVARSPAEHWWWNRARGGGKHAGLGQAACVRRARPVFSSQPCFKQSP